MFVSKSTFPALLAAALLAAPACKSELDDKPAATVKDAEPAKADDKKDEAPAADKKDDAAAKKMALVSDKSSIEFVGAKVTGDHRGSFGTPTGSLEMAGDAVKGFSVEVDTTKLSIEPEKLAQHLSSHGRSRLQAGSFGLLPLLIRCNPAKEPLPLLRIGMMQGTSGLSK